MAQTAFQRQSWQAEQEPAGFDLGGLPRTAHVPLLALVYGIGLSLYVAIDPARPWILLAVLGLVALGTDGIVRSHPRAQLRGWSETAPHLFVPTLFALASGLFLKDVVDGYRVVPAVIISTILLAGALYGEYGSALTYGPSYALGRLLLNLITYLSAFAFYAVVYQFNVDLLPAAFATGLFSGLLAIEIFREAEADTYKALLFSAVIGLVVAEARWALHFIPIDDFLAAILLLLIFYQSTGLVQHHLTHRLDRAVATEFSAVTAIGLLVVIVGRALGFG